MSYRYLLILHRNNERALDGSAYLECAKHVLSSMLFAAMGLFWSTVLLATSLMDGLQLFTVQMLREYNFSSSKQKFALTHQREENELTTNVRAGLLEELLEIGLDTPKSVEKLKVIIAQRRKSTPSLGEYIKERDSIYQEFKSLHRQYGQANYLNRPWNNREFLKQMNQLFLRVLVNSNDLLRLIELSFYDKGINTLPSKHMAKALCGTSWPENNFHPNDKLHYAYMDYLLKFVETDNQMAQKQRAFHRDYQFPEIANYDIHDSQYHRHWIELYNTFIKVGIIDYYSTYDTNFKHLLAAERSTYCLYFQEINPATFKFGKQPGSQEVKPHHHDEDNCAFGACELLRMGQFSDLSTQDFSRQCDLGLVEIRAPK